MHANRAKGEHGLRSDSLECNYLWWIIRAICRLYVEFDDTYFGTCVQYKLNFGGERPMIDKTGIVEIGFSLRWQIGRDSVSFRRTVFCWGPSLRPFPKVLARFSVVVPVSVSWSSSLQYGWWGRKMYTPFVLEYMSWNHVQNCHRCHSSVVDVLLWREELKTLIGKVPLSVTKLTFLVLFLS